MMRLISDECLSSFLASPLHLPSCSFVQQYIRPRHAVQYAEIASSRTCPAVASSPHISGWPWHPPEIPGTLQRRWDFTRRARGYFQYLPSGQYSKTLFFYAAFESAIAAIIARDAWLEQNYFSFFFSLLFFFFHASCWGWLTGGGGVWIWRRESGYAAALLGPIWGLLQPLACSYSLQSSLQESAVITHARFTFTCFLPQVKHIAAHGARVPRIHYGILIIALISTSFFLVPVIYGNKNVIQNVYSQTLFFMTLNINLLKDL